MNLNKKASFGCPLGVPFLLLLVLQTRTVYLAVIAGLMLYLPMRAWLEPGFRSVFFKKILPLGVLGIGLLAALLFWKGQGSTLAERLNPATYLESASANERRFVWAKTDLLNEEHFWLGVGNGSGFWFPSKKIEGAFRLQEQGIVFTRVHNDYLEIRAEMGLVGFILFAGLFIAALWPPPLRFGEPPMRAEGTTCWYFQRAAGYCIIQYFDFPRERIELQAILGLLFAYLAWCSRSVWDGLPGISIRRYSTLFLSLLVAGLAFNLVLGWQRIKGEIHTVAVLKAHSRGNFPVAQREAAAASNTFYEYNDVTIPLQWFEGIAFYQMNRVDESVAAFEVAYRLNPWAFQVINNYALALVRAGKYREAFVPFEQALAINPRYDEGKFNLAYAWYVLGDPDKATTWLNRVDTIPNPQTEGDRIKNQQGADTKG